jgi:glyoxylase-like metal-dependent hydrolase (beta-lactamase superfamily II)
LLPSRAENVTGCVSTKRCAARAVGVWLALTLFVLPSMTAGQGRPAPKRTEVADGIYLFASSSYGDVGLDGNSIVIVSSDGVLVFDSNGTPAAAASVIAEIRRITRQPVRYVVNSHWHWDHWYGNESYQQAYPDVRIISHERTRQMMMGPALAFNRPGVEDQLPAYIKSLELKVASADPASAGLPRLQHLLDEDRFFLTQKANTHHTFPNVTFTGELDLYMGERHIRVMHHDRAVTPGDAFLYLPREKILITGDLLVNPISFALSCYPTGWLRTLEKLNALEVSMIIPGHGEPLRDKALLQAHMEAFRELLDRGAAAKANGLDPDQAKAAILPDLHRLMLRMTHDDATLIDQFRTYLVDWYLHRVYDELNGALTDDIAPIPKS